MKNIIFKKIAFPVFLAVTFVIVVGILYSPVLFKGYPSESMNSRLILAKKFCPKRN